MRNKGKYFLNKDIDLYNFNLNIYRFGFMKLLNKYWDGDLCLTKIKVNEKLKTIGFDVKNDRLTVVTHDRTIYFIDLPKE
jgi:hypothetical protein